MAKLPHPWIRDSKAIRKRSPSSLGSSHLNWVMAKGLPTCKAMKVFKIRLYCCWLTVTDCVVTLWKATNLLIINSYLRSIWRHVYITKKVRSEDMCFLFFFSFFWLIVRREKDNKASIRKKSLVILIIIIIKCDFVDASSSTQYT